MYLSSVMEDSLVKKKRKEKKKRVENVLLERYKVVKCLPFKHFPHILYISLLSRAIISLSFKKDQSFIAMSVFNVYSALISLAALSPDSTAVMSRKTAYSSQTGGISLMPGALDSRTTCSKHRR